MNDIGSIILVSNTTIDICVILLCISTFFFIIFAAILMIADFFLTIEGGNNYIS